MKTGFKATYDFICRDHKFEIGKTYELPGIPIPCKYGFHYCQDPINVLEYYSIQYNFRLLEIEDLGESITQEDKTVTNKIRIIREIPKEEYYPLFGIVNNELKITTEDYWYKRKYDERNNLISTSDSYGNWENQKFDERNNLIYYQNSNRTWQKYEYDERNNCTYSESSSGYHVFRTFDENNTEISYKSYYKQ